MGGIHRPNQATTAPIRRFEGLGVDLRRDRLGTFIDDDDVQKGLAPSPPLTGWCFTMGNLNHDSARFTTPATLTAWLRCIGRSG